MCAVLEEKDLFNIRLDNGEYIGVARDNLTVTMEVSCIMCHTCTPEEVIIPALARFLCGAAHEHAACAVCGPDLATRRAGVRKRKLRF